MHSTESSFWLGYASLILLMHSEGVVRLQWFQYFIVRMCTPLIHSTTILYGNRVHIVIPNIQPYNTTLSIQKK